MRMSLEILQLAGFELPRTIPTATLQGKWLKAFVAKISDHSGGQYTCEDL